MVAFANFRRVRPEQGAFFFLFTEARASTITFFRFLSQSFFSTQTFRCRLVKKFLFIYVFILGITLKKIVTK